MDTSIRVSHETKAKLERLKRRDESFDELLARLAAAQEPVDTGSWDAETADRARRTVERFRDN